MSTIWKINFVSNHQNGYEYIKDTIMMNDDQLSFNLF